jgi:hypothetical protein
VYAFDLGAVRLGIVNIQLDTKVKENPERMMQLLSAQDYQSLLAAAPALPHSNLTVAIGPMALAS